MEGSNYHFSADYYEARGEFLEAAQNAGATIESFILPVSGPNGIPALGALRALRSENWLHHSGEFGTPRARRIKSELLAAFNPDSESWRETVWKKGSLAVGQAINWLADQPLASDACA